MFATADCTLHNAVTHCSTSVDSLDDTEESWTVCMVHVDRVVYVE